MSLAHGKENVWDAAKERRYEIEHKEPTNNRERTPATSGEEVNGSEHRPSEHDEGTGIVME